jgi:hypothetical protein
MIKTSHAIRRKGARAVGAEAMDVAELRAAEAAGRSAMSASAPESL